MIKEMISLIFFWLTIPAQIVVNPDITLQAQAYVAENTSNFSGFRDTLQLSFQEGINKSQEYVIQGSIHRNEDTIKNIVKDIYTSVKGLLEHNIARSFGISHGIEQKVTEIFDHLCKDFDLENGQEVVSKGLTRVRRATSYFKMMVGWAAKKAEQLTKDQCLMLHYVLDLFEGSLEHQRQEIESLGNRDSEKELTLSSIDKLHQQVCEIKRDIAEKIIN